MKKILVTGSSGFLGCNIIPILENNYQVFGVNSKDFNLIDSKQCESMFQIYKPDVVLHLAAKSGGILANKQEPASFFYQNMMITGNIWESSKNHRIQKLIYVLPGCAFPANAENPIKESSMWDGFPDIHPAPGSIVRRAATAAAYAYKKQYNLNSSIIIPSNAFGKFDCFDEINSHVVSSMILKFHKAKTENKKDVTCWGDGLSTRDFIYAEDIANCIPYFIQNDINFPSENPCLENVCNLSAESETSVKDLAEAIKQIVGYNGEIIWDITKPSGPPRKVFSNQRMKSLGLSCPTPLKEGLEKTYKWYLSQLPY